MQSVQSVPSKPLLLLTLIVSLVGCQWGGAASGDELGESPFVPLPDAEPQTMGYFMAQYAKSLKQWHNLKLTAKKEAELRRLNAIERSLQKRSNDRLEELLDVLLIGSTINRQTAAMALGFSADMRAMGPLLNTLNDPDQRVVQNALTGLGLLGLPDTPTDTIASYLIIPPRPLDAEQRCLRAAVHRFEPTWR